MRYWLILALVTVCFGFLGCRAENEMLGHSSDVAQEQQASSQESLADDGSLSADKSEWKFVTATPYCLGIQTEDVARFLANESDILSIPSGSRVVLGLDCELQLNEIMLQFEGSGIPRQSRIYSTDMIGIVVYDTIWEQDEAGIDELIIPIMDKKAAYLAIEIPEGNQPTLLKGLTVTGSPSYPIYFRTENEVRMDGKDVKNPLSVWRQPMLQSYYTWADELLAGRGELTDHQKIVLFMKSMQNYKLGLNNAIVLQTIKDQIGSCGNYSNVLAALAATQGIPADIITLANFPKNAGHVVVEVEINGKKSIYDPTYAAYYTSTPENDKSPYVLSLEELRQGHGKNENVTRVVGFPERVNWDQAWEFLGPEIYEKASPIGVIGPDNKLYYPLVLDYTQKNKIESAEYGSVYQGAPYLGAEGVNNSHIWSLTGLEAGVIYQFRVRGTFVGGELLLPDGNRKTTFPAYATIEGGIILQGANFTFDIENSNTEWVIQFRADASMVYLTLSHDFTGPEFHYINIDRYLLEQVDD